jgi:hypothetical protein
MICEEGYSGTTPVEEKKLTISKSKARKLKSEIQGLIDELIDESINERNSGTVSKLADKISMRINYKLLQLVNAIGGEK